MNPGEELARKFALIFEDSVRKIRRDIPTEGIVEAALSALESVATPPARSIPVDTPAGTVELPVEGLVAMFNDINHRHKSKIRELADSVGVVVGETESSPESASDRLVSEAEGSMVLRVDCLIVSVDKDFALKVVSLGVLP